MIESVVDFFQDVVPVSMRFSCYGSPHKLMTNAYITEKHTDRM